MRKLVTYAVLATATIALTLAAKASDVLPGDVALSQRLQSIDSAVFSAFMENVTHLGSSLAILIVALAAATLLLVRGPRNHIALLALVACALLLSPAIKALIDRPRPELALVNVFSTESTSSFPSGHAFSAFLVFGALIYMAPSLVNGIRPLTWLLRGLLVLLILAIGVSRIYLGLHWSSDVLGGYLFALLALLASIWLYESMPLSHSKGASGKKGAERQAKGHPLPPARRGAVKGRARLASSGRCPKAAGQ